MLRRFDGRKRLWLFASLMLALSPAFAQTAAPAPMAADAHPSFDVVTIKPSAPKAGGRNFRLDGHRVQAENATVQSLIAFAYELHDKQIVNDPPWLDNDRFDINGVFDKEGMPKVKQYREIIQQLLADRFALKLHREKRELSVYAITIAKGGPKLPKSKQDEPGGFPEETGDRHGSQQGMIFTDASMEHFTLAMRPFFEDRPLVDQTGLTGKYDFSLHWTPDNVESTDPNAPPGIFTAIQEQLGLKLEPVKAPVDVLVIDHVEKPSAN